MIVRDTGEPFFVRDQGLLESACQRPIDRWHYGDVHDVVTLAMDLLFGIARNHPFEQGNKRTGFEAAVIFLLANGYDLDVGDEEYVAWMTVLVLTRELTVSDFEDWIRPYVIPCQDP